MLQNSAANIIIQVLNVENCKQGNLLFRKSGNVVMGEANQLLFTKLLTFLSNDIPCSDFMAIKTFIFEDRMHRLSLLKFS